MTLQANFRIASTRMRRVTPRDSRSLVQISYNLVTLVNFLIRDTLNSPKTFKKYPQNIPSTVESISNLCKTLRIYLDILETFEKYFSIFLGHSKFIFTFSKLPRNVSYTSEHYKTVSRPFPNSVIIFHSPPEKFQTCFRNNFE